MATAYSRVPTPTVPPSTKPVTTTVISMAVRTRRTDTPVRRCRPVISPSRGPGPNRAAMYRPVAAPFSTIPDAIRATRTAMPRASGTTASVASIATPITSTLETVPSPGRCRSGIHSSSTAAPTAVSTTPMDSPVRSDRPWCRTFHGSSPSPDRTSSAELAPYRARPA